MALTPEQALGDKLELEKQVIEQMEKEVDDYLLKNWNGRNTVTFCYSTRDYNSFVVAEVVRRFRAAKWNVTPKSDQRDGSWLEFSESVDDRSYEVFT